LGLLARLLPLVYHNIHKKLTATTCVCKQHDLERNGDEINSQMTTKKINPVQKPPKETILQHFYWAASNTDPPSCTTTNRLIERTRVRIEQNPMPSITPQKPSQKSAGIGNP
jgi:hypothetical protein